MSAIGFFLFRPPGAGAVVFAPKKEPALVFENVWRQLPEFGGRDCGIAVGDAANAGNGLQREFARLMKLGRRVAAGMFERNLWTSFFRTHQRVAGRAGRSYPASRKSAP